MSGVESGWKIIARLERKADNAANPVERLRALAELSTAYHDDYQHYDASAWLLDAVEVIETLTDDLAQAREYIEDLERS